MVFTLLLSILIIEDLNPFEEAEKSALNAISIFEKNPFSSEAEFAAKEIMIYAKHNLRSIIYIDEKVLPWIHEEEDYKYGSLLIVAFVAGSMKPQLIHGKIKDHSLDGVLAMIKLYKEILDLDPDAMDPTMEIFLKKRRNGNLNEFLREEMETPSTRTQPTTLKNILEINPYPAIIPMA